MVSDACDETAPEDGLPGVVSIQRRARGTAAGIRPGADQVRTIELIAVEGIADTPGELPALEGIVRRLQVTAQGGEGRVRQQAGQGGVDTPGHDVQAQRVPLRHPASRGTSPSLGVVPLRHPASRGTSPSLGVVPLRHPASRGTSPSLGVVLLSGVTQEIPGQFPDKGGRQGIAQIGRNPLGPGQAQVDPAGHGRTRADHQLRGKGRSERGLADAVGQQIEQCLDQIRTADVEHVQRPMARASRPGS